MLALRAQCMSEQGPYGAATERGGHLLSKLSAIQDLNVPDRLLASKLSVVFCDVATRQFLPQGNSISAVSFVEELVSVRIGDHA